MEVRWILLLCLVQITHHGNIPVKRRCFHDSLNDGETKTTQEIFLKRDEKFQLEVESSLELEFSVDGGSGDYERYGFTCSKDLGTCNLQFVYPYSPYTYSQLIVLSEKEGEGSVQYRFAERDPPSNCSAVDQAKIQGNNPTIICQMIYGKPHKKCIMGKTGKNCDQDILSPRKRSLNTLREVECPNIRPTDFFHVKPNPAASTLQLSPEKEAVISSVLLIVLLLFIVTCLIYGFLIAAYQNFLTRDNYSNKGRENDLLVQ